MNNGSIQLSLYTQSVSGDEKSAYVHEVSDKFSVHDFHQRSGVVGEKNTGLVTRGGALVKRSDLCQGIWQLRYIHDSFFLPFSVTQSLIFLSLTKHSLTRKTFFSISLHFFFSPSHTHLGEICQK